jgi:hydrogenase maturation protease
VMAEVQAHSEEILVLGIGNPLMGDDGVGIRVVEMLAGETLPPYVVVKEAGLPGWGLPSWFDGKSTVFLVDAMQMGEAPGSWRRFETDDLEIVMENNTLSLHQNDLACGLALSQAMNLMPENLLLYGIEPANIAPGDDLSPEVEASLPELIKNLINDLEKIKE